MRLLLASLTAALTTSAAAPAGAATAAAAPQQLPTSSTARDTIVFALLGGDPENHDIWTMDGAGGHQRQLTSNSVADLEPTLVPDGSKIAWARWSDYPFNVGPAYIWVMNADGTDQHPLTNLHDDITHPHMVPGWHPHRVHPQLPHLGDQRRRHRAAPGLNPRARSTSTRTGPPTGARSRSSSRRRRE